MTEAVMVFCNCADEAEAVRIGRAAVDHQLAACANIGSAIQSIYRWQGAIETARETLLILKTTIDAFPALENIIRSLHSYDTPEILAAPVVAGSERYIAWLKSSVTADFSSASSKVPLSPAE